MLFKYIKVKTKGQIEGEKLLVPKLRFKEFKDEWKKKKIGNIISEIIEKTNDTINYPLWSLTIEDGVTPKTERYKRGFLVKKEDNFKTVHFNNFVYNPMNLRFGAIAYHTRNIDISVSGYYNIFEINNLKTIGFWDNYFKCPAMIKRYNNIATGSLIEKKRVHYSQFIELLVPQPSVEEQIVISQFFISLNKKIELQKQKIEALKIYKKGLIQKLIDFNNSPERSVSEFGTIITGTTPSKLIPSYWNNGTIVWVTPSDITESKDIYTSYNMLTVDGLNAGRFIPAGSVLVTCIASIGKNAILKTDGSCNQQINAIIPNENFNAGYLYYLFEMKKDYLQSIAGTSATSIINKSSFEKLVFKVPSIEQQNKSSKILNCLELKIENEKFKLKKLNLLKKSLLQQMFI